MKKYLIATIGAIFIVLSGCSSKETESMPPVEILIDAKQFAGISEKELIEKMGEPESREEWNYNKGSAIYPIVSCIYENNRFEFLLNNDQVSRISIYADSYNTNDGKPFTFSNKEDVLKMFGIESKDSKYAKKTDTNSALRYENMGDIKSVWIPSYENSSFDEVKIDFSNLFS